MCFLLSFCSFSPNGEYIVWSLFHMALSLCDVVTVSKWLGARSTQNAFLCSCRKRAMKVKAPPTEYEHLISSGFFPENNDVIERKLSNEGINSIGLKRAKRKQKTHSGDYYFRKDRENEIMFTKRSKIAKRNSKQSLFAIWMTRMQRQLSLSLLQNHRKMQSINENNKLTYMLWKWILSQRTILWHGRPWLSICYLNCVYFVLFCLA